MFFGKWKKVLENLCFQKKFGIKTEVVRKKVLIKNSLTEKKTSFPQETLIYMLEMKPFHSLCGKRPQCPPFLPQGCRASGTTAIPICPRKPGMLQTQGRRCGQDFHRYLVCSSSGNVSSCPTGGLTHEKNSFCKYCCQTQSVVPVVQGFTVCF